MPLKSQPLKFESQFGKIVFHLEVLEVFDKHKQTGFFRAETGGQLFASLKHGQIEIVRATESGESGKRGRNFFRPNRGDEQADIRAAFAEDVHFIGDWHTHPEKKPTPSGTDIVKATEIFDRSTHELNGFCLVIVGTAVFPDGLWCGIVSRAGVVGATPIQIGD
jgi:integrative and conjugative element protein (TIGR02256 family)